MTGGDAHVLPTANPDQLTLFQQKQLDAVWTVEPWVSRLEMEAGGKILVEEREAVTTVLVSSAKFPRQPPGSCCPVRRRPCRADGMGSEPSGGGSENRAGGARSRDARRYLTGSDCPRLDRY